MLMQEKPGTGPSAVYRCPFSSCSKTFKRQDRLDTHMRVHTGERPFVCEVEGCGKTYARSQHLSRHVENSHKLKDGDSMKFSCPICRRELANVYCLQNHVKAEHEDPVGPKRYECPEQGCTQSFHKKKQLVHHRLTDHTDHLTEAKKCHRCPHEGCGKTFTWENLLKRHMKVHQGYTCDSEGCGKVFPNWSSLRKHVSQDHKKVFSCEECGIQFSRKPNLTQHMKRKHQGEESNQKFTCSVEGCGRVYSYKSNLALHVREMHEGESIWKNRQRIRKPAKKPRNKKPTKKISLAAKLCGLDDRGEVLKLAKPRRSAKAKTDDQASSSFPTETTTLPMEERTTTLPMEERTTTLPMEERTTTLPMEERTTTLPMEERTTTLPMEERTTTLPMEERTTTLPMEERTTTLPIEERTTTLPMEERTTALPMEEQITTLPIEEQITTLPIEELTTLLLMENQQFSNSLEPVSMEIESFNDGHGCELEDSFPTKETQARGSEQSSAGHETDQESPSSAPGDSCTSYLSDRAGDKIRS